MSLAAECALPGVPLALVAAALADGHAGLQQRPGDGRVVLPSGGSPPRGWRSRYRCGSRHSRMHLTISARSCLRKPASAMPAGTGEQPGTVAQTSPSGAPPPRSRPVGTRPERWQCAAAAAGPRGLAVAASAPADRQANVPRVRWIRGPPGPLGRLPFRVAVADRSCVGIGVIIRCLISAAADSAAPGIRPVPASGQRGG